MRRKQSFKCNERRDKVNTIDAMEKLNLFCSICRDESDISFFRLLPQCGHTFHDTCLWQMSGEKKCPICRVRLPHFRGSRIHIQRLSPEERVAEETIADVIRRDAEEVVGRLNSVRQARVDAAAMLRELTTSYVNDDLEDELDGVAEELLGAVGGEDPAEDDSDKENKPISSCGNVAEFYTPRPSGGPEKKMEMIKESLKAMMQLNRAVLRITKETHQLYTDQCLNVASLIGGERRAEHMRRASRVNEVAAELLETSAEAVRIGDAASRLSRIAESEIKSKETSFAPLPAPRHRGADLMLEVATRFDSMVAEVESLSITETQRRVNSISSVEWRGDEENVRKIYDQVSKIKAVVPETASWGIPAVANATELRVELLKSHQRERRFKATLKVIGVEYDVIKEQRDHAVAQIGRLRGSYDKFIAWNREMFTLYTIRQRDDENNIAMLQEKIQSSVRLMNGAEVMVDQEMELEYAAESPFMSNLQRAVAEACVLRRIVAESRTLLTTEIDPNVTFNERVEIGRERIRVRMRIDRSNIERRSTESGPGMMVNRPETIEAGPGSRQEGQIGALAQQSGRGRGQGRGRDNQERRPGASQENQPPNEGRRGRRGRGGFRGRGRRHDQPATVGNAASGRPIEQPTHEEEEDAALARYMATMVDQMRDQVEASGVLNQPPLSDLITTLRGMAEEAATASGAPLPRDATSFELPPAVIAQTAEAQRRRRADENRRRREAVGNVPGTNHIDRTIVRELEDIIGMDVLLYGTVRRPGESYEEAAMRMDNGDLAHHRRTMEQKIRAEIAGCYPLSDDEAEKIVLNEAYKDQAHIDTLTEELLEEWNGNEDAGTPIVEIDGGSDDAEADDDDDATTVRGDDDDGNETGSSE